MMPVYHTAHQLAQGTNFHSSEFCPCGMLVLVDINKEKVKV